MKQELSKTTTTSNKIIIPLPLTDLNTYINKERTQTSRCESKKTNDLHLRLLCKRAMSHGVSFSTPCRIKFTWIIPNKKKDPDNIAFAKKFIFDGMMEAGFIENDNLNYIEGFSDYFIVDKDEESRVIVEVEYD